MSIFLSKQNVWTDLVLKIKQDLMFDCRFKSKACRMSAMPLSLALSCSLARMGVCVLVWALMRCDENGDDAERPEFPSKSRHMTFVRHWWRANAFTHSHSHSHAQCYQNCTRFWTNFQAHTKYVRAFACACVCDRMRFWLGVYRSLSLALSLCVVS